MPDEPKASSLGRRTGGLIKTETMELIQINTGDPNSNGKKLELKDVQEKLSAAQGPQCRRPRWLTA